MQGRLVFKIMFLSSGLSRRLQTTLFPLVVVLLIFCCVLISICSLLPFYCYYEVVITRPTPLEQGNSYEQVRVVHLGSLLDCSGAAN